MENHVLGFHGAMRPDPRERRTLAARALYDAAFAWQPRPSRIAVGRWARLFAWVRGR